MSATLISTRTATSVWQGNLREGNGTVALGSGAFTGKYSFDSRFQTGEGTTPEELIGAAHSACFAMAASAEFMKVGLTANKIDCTAHVVFESVDQKPTITKITLDVTCDVPGVTEEQFQTIMDTTKAGCPISRALAAVETIELNAKLA